MPSLTYTYAIWLVASLLRQSCFAQVALPIQSDTKVMGVYTTFKEFKLNNPSIKIKLSAVSMNVKDDDDNTYELEIEEDNPIKIKNIWGFCDGINVFRANVSKNWKSNHVFYKLQTIGRYCVYTTPGGVDEGSSMMTPIGGGGGMVMTGGPIGYGPKGFAININNGEDYEIDKSLVETIIERDSSIFADYKNDKNRKKRYSEFIKLYSEKHPEEIE